MTYEGKVEWRFSVARAKVGGGKGWGWVGLQGWAGCTGRIVLSEDPLGCRADWLWGWWEQGVGGTPVRARVRNGEFGA